MCLWKRIQCSALPFCRVGEVEESWKKWKKVFGVFLTDLWKACDCLPHDLIIAKLNAYGFNLPALNLSQNYLSNKKKRTKINDSYSSWTNILLGPLLFNIFLIDLFLIVKDINIASYADNNTLYDSCDILKKSYYHCKVHPKKFFYGYEIIRWRVLLKSVIL